MITGYSVRAPETPLAPPNRPPQRRRAEFGRMTSARSKTVRWSPQRLAAPLVRVLTGSGRRVALVSGLIVLFVAASILAWNRWGRQVVDDPRYLLQADDVQVTPQPSWIATSVKDEVIRDGGLAGLSFLDTQLAAKVRDAFAVHSWVANVTQVRKLPGRIVVDLEYRKPVAMVEVTTDDRRGLLPIDAGGVVLPPEAFTSDDVRDFLRIAAGPTKPAGPVGTPWGDERVSGAARIAEAWGDAWQEAGLYRISIERPPGSASAVPVYEISTRWGARVVWGQAPGRERAGEADAAAKIECLLDYVRSKNSLEAENKGRPIVLDIQQGDVIVLAE
jgi:hypothetical protein